MNSTAQRRKAGRKAGNRGTPPAFRKRPRDFTPVTGPERNLFRIPTITMALVVAVVIFGAALRLSNLGNVLSRSPDEATYTRQASVLLKGGWEGTRAMAQTYLADAQLQLFPPPTRIGFMSLVALTMKLTGVSDERAGAYISCAASIASLLVAIWMGLRFLGIWPALLGGAFLAVFPPELVIARRCWSDALLGLLGILMFYCTMEIFSGRKRWFFSIALVLVGSGAVLVKETSILIYGPCVLIACWALLGKREFEAAGRLLGTAALGAGVAAAVLVVGLGGLNLPITILLTGARTNTTNTYALNYQSGPAYLLLWAFEALSPLTFILAAFGLVITIVKAAVLSHPRLRCWRG